MVRPPRCLVMGILNVTPDSFSDGGLWSDPESAIAHGFAMVADGADLVDVGGESTRPGAERPPLQQELARVLPVVSALAADGVRVSIDTMRAEVAEAAVEAGATVINDVSGGLADPRILAVAAAAEVTYVAMHWRAHSDRMQSLAQYDDVVAEVRAELAARADAAGAAGIASDRLVLDPGLGFAKLPDHNWALLRELPALAELGHPLLIGASRKSFLGALLADGSGPRPVGEREAANTAITALVATSAWGVRVHDVRAAADAITVATRLAGEETR